ncbi:pirin family protein [Williamsia sterculiae]|uniref:Pirin n=1 Tax=Williamsia sterculiae TaxID=1344003 RepID=A0A1N7E3B2_9NOCA|nr:pirin family protein [Williamsia sterculiae]SIR82508.1 hypothetical protein SAMN05445060_1135 [Williamsia sterculiae]
MSNLDRHPDESVLVTGDPGSVVQILEPRSVPLGGPRAMTVYRTLPQRIRSMVGAWCFVDHYGPDPVAESGGMAVPRHPHTGLATVSWLFGGEIDHLDSAGNSAVVRPGELNLMIAGRGITHSEFSTAQTVSLHGVQLWYALPESTRHGGKSFHHHVPLPVEVAGARARVFIGELLGAVSPVATKTTDLLGAEIVIEPGAEITVGIRPDFEHAVLAESHPVSVNGTPVAHRVMGYLPTGTDTLTLRAGTDGARVLVLGGVPFDEEIVMWWNFVGRTHEEIAEYRRRYQAELGFEPSAANPADEFTLFGPFPDDQPAPLPAPVLPRTRIRPRHRLR